MKINKTACVVLAALLLCAQANAVKKVKETPSSQKAKSVETVQENSLKRKVAIARFSNETTYAKGAFYDKENDPLGKQTLDILSAKLAASGKFILLERSDLELINAEQNLSGITAQKIGADYLIIGSLTKYGRKNTGETGLVTRTKRQTVEAGVSIRLVDVSTGQIIYSEEAEGTAETQTKTTETWQQLTQKIEAQNTFTTNDVLVCDCSDGSIRLMNAYATEDVSGGLHPELGALGNDWESFVLTKGTNQIGTMYSDWVTDAHKPTFTLRYRERFL